MRAIDKGKEPPSLTAHRGMGHSSYDNYQDKDALRTALVKEQRGLCCYCMGQICDDRNQMKIEHWQCQANYPKEQLSYRNMLGACLGGEGQSGRKQHCDTKKGDSELHWNPAEPSHQIEKRLAYKPDGTIYSMDSGFDRQLNDVLNLNLAWLKNNRKAVFDGVFEWWEWWKKKRQPVSKRRLKQEIDNREKPEPLIPYVQVAISFLQEKLARMEQ